MKHALAAHRGDGAHEAARRGTERPLRPPEEVLWAEMVRYLTMALLTVATYRGTLGRNGILRLSSQLPTLR